MMVLLSLSFSRLLETHHIFSSAEGIYFSSQTSRYYTENSEMCERIQFPGAMEKLNRGLQLQDFWLSQTILIVFGHLQICFTPCRDLIFKMISRSLCISSLCRWQSIPNQGLLNFQKSQFDMVKVFSLYSTSKLSALTDNLDIVFGHL
jgi:hypothetical protein